MAPKTVLIIGAGPAGLSAASRLLRDGGGQYHPIVVEASDFVGGIATTVEYKGNRLDMGGHRFFTKSDEVRTEWFDRYGHLFKERARVSRILFSRSFFDYPITLSAITVKQLGILRALSAGLSYLWSRVLKRPEHSLEDFYINRFGPVLYRLFFENYTAKLWGVHPRFISPDWGSQRVKGLSLTKTITSLVRKPRPSGAASAQETSLIDRFHYPPHGPGQYWDAVARRIVKDGSSLLLNHEVTALELGDDGGDLGIKRVRVHNHNTDTTLVIAPDAVISSMPIKDLIHAMGSAVPPHIAHIASGLPYRDFITVGVLVEKLLVTNPSNQLIADCWIYIQEPDVALGRIQIFNNWSTEMVASPQDTVWLGLEYFCTEGDALWTMPREEFIEFALNELVVLGFIERNNVLDTTLVKVKKAYPGYFGAFEQFDDVRAFLQTIDNLYCVGRNGQHRYNNMDHSMLTSFEAVRVLLGESSDKDALWTVNTESQYLESSREYYARSNSHIQSVPAP